jgi:hypothetical protein
MHSKTFRFLFLIISFLLAGFAPLQPARALPEESFSSDEIVPGELIVGTETGFSANALQSTPGVTVRPSRPQLAKLNARVVNVPPGQEAEFMRRLRRQKGVRFVEPNYRVQAELTPDDTLWPQQYGLPQIQAPAAWDITTGSGSVILAIIDSGIDSSHPEFAGRILPGYDFVDDDTTPNDQCGHGTHVAGIAAAQGNNAAGVAGVAWNVQIMPVRVLNGFCGGSILDVAEAMVWAVERGARVINLSLGTSAPSTLLQNGSYYAYTHGAAIFAAAGNAGTAPVVYPAAYAWVMAVGATDATITRASFSNTGTALDLMAPGSNIVSTLPQYGGFLYNNPCPSAFPCGQPTDYGTLSGTSMASGYAAGAAALLASLPQFDSPDKIYQALTGTALDLDVAGRDDNTGYGLIQLYDALLFTPTIVPTPTPLPPSVSYDVLDSQTCGNLVSYNWRDATGGSFVPVFGNDGSATVAMPFTFDFGGVIYSSITVSANGYLTFIPADGGIKDNFFLPGIAEPNNFIAPFWDDLNPSAGGFIYQATFGAPGNREYVIEWYQIPRAGMSSTTSRLTFEVVLFESNNDILFQYQTLTGTGADGSSATVGVEYADGTVGREYSYNQSGALSAGLAILFTPFATGSTPPSSSCSVYTRPVDTSGGLFEVLPFCVSIPPGAMQHSGTLQIQLVNSVPAIPRQFLDLHHYADITLSFVPPVPLAPMPEAYVCYHYTTQDLLKAGGHPENLFFITYDDATKRWQSLPTAANPLLQTITARAPHFSYYAVVTSAAPVELPVTGAVLAPFVLQYFSGFLIVAAIFFMLSIIRKRRMFRGQERPWQ